MIKSFADKRTEQVFQGKAVKKLAGDVQKRALRKLDMIDAAIKIEDLEGSTGQ